MTCTSLVFQNTSFDIIDQSGRPWLKGLQIANALGFKNPSSDIANLFDRNRDEFTDSMTALIKLPDLDLQTASAGQIRETRIFSLRGCHLLAMLSRTKVAKEFRKWVLDILDRESASQPSPALSHEISTEQAQHLKELVQIITESGKQGYGETWARFQRKFHVNSYLRLPASQFDAACEYLRGKVDAPSIAVIAQKHFPQLTLPGETNQLPLLNDAEIEAYALERLRHFRFIVSFSANGSIAMRSIPHDASIATDEQFVKMVADPSQFSRHLLAPLIQSAANRLVA
jgi:prophage antirepressor-like protein